MSQKERLKVTCKYFLTLQLLKTSLLPSLIFHGYYLGGQRLLRCLVVSKQVLKEMR